ncbi:MAG: D-glycero-beta-D-manno-heptose 1-phosphate adenylyltransferase [Bdellovibrionales bacterium]|nr:D-glycero-beta-D-manno-heptose 1-phosphate adenylyltransferase [Bdellovibrionales bacterium]
MTTSAFRTSTKVKSTKALKHALARKTGVVFTNGCFDILHPGHIEYLEQARRQGRCLVVALNSDASVSRLKGPDRPVNTLSDRMRVLAALECVDFVTWFEDDTPLETIKSLGSKIRVLVKGGDWKPDQIVGGREVLSWGGKVKSLKFIAGKSTTHLLKKIQSL